MKARKNIGSLLFTVVVISFLVIGAIVNLGVLEKPLERLSDEKITFEEWIDEVKLAYVNDVEGKDVFINVNGLFARLTGRTVYNEVSILNNGMLLYDVVEDLDMKPLANGVSDFDEFLSENDIPFLFIQAPIKTDLGNTLVPYGVVNNGNKDADELLGELNKNGVETMDLRPILVQTPEDVAENFYKTDHHWNVKGAFKAFGEVLAVLDAQFPEAEIDLSLADRENWTSEVYEDWFLGSRGKRVGVFFGGIDDLEIYKPKFKTDMSCYVMHHRAYYDGDFTDAVIREEYLDEPDYFDENPYCVHIGGEYPLVHHVNRLAKNDLKILLIKESFALPFQCYLSTAVKELDVIDPRRYTASTVAEYVATSQPDMVIMMMNPSAFPNTSFRKLGAEEGRVHVAQTNAELVAHLDEAVLSSPEDVVSEYHTVAKELISDCKYSVTIEDFDVTRGDVDSFTVALYNATEKELTNSYVFECSEGPYEWSFVTPDDGDDYRFLVYCGRSGYTNGNGVVYRGIDLYRYQKPTE